MQHLSASGRKVILIKRTDPEEFSCILAYVEAAPLFAEVEAGGKQFVLIHGGRGKPMLLRLEDLQAFYME